MKWCNILYEIKRNIAFTEKIFRRYWPFVQVTDIGVDMTATLTF